jgi:hypothetical protein
VGVFSAVFEPSLFLIKRYTAGPKDALGRPTRVLASSTPADGRLDLSGSVEGEAFVVDQFRATMTLGTDLRSGDEVEARGLTYTVEGSPAVITAPGSKTVGVVTAVLKYVGPVTP